MRRLFNRRLNTPELSMRRLFNRRLNTPELSMRRAFGVFAKRTTKRRGSRTKERRGLKPCKRLAKSKTEQAPRQQLPKKTPFGGNRHVVRAVWLLLRETF